MQASAPSRPASTASRTSKTSRRSGVSRHSGSSEPIGIQVVGSDEEAEVVPMSILGGPIVSSPNAKRSPRPVSGTRRQDTQRDYTVHVPSDGVVESPSDIFSVHTPLEELEPRRVAQHNHTSYFRSSRSPSSHHTVRTWKQQRYARNRFAEPIDDNSSDGSSYDENVRPKKSLKPWRRFVQKLKNYDERMVKGWKEDIDTLLVFAGLFSAVLTAFIVESYKLLQQDSGQASATLLQVVANHLLDNEAPQITSTSPPSSGPSTFAVRINILWFMSLVFSLASASVGILAKQWLREYMNRASSSPREAARIRQFRYAGLIRWHVPEIIAFLPVLLQLSLALFFVGILDLLWQLDSVVAGVITFFVSLSLSFLIGTTILPTISRDSPHRSPQALAVYLLRQWIESLSISLLIKLIHGNWIKLRLTGMPIIHIDFAMQQSTWRHRLAKWLAGKLSQRQPRNWMQRERFYVDQQQLQLDHRLLVDADALFMDDKVLAQLIRPCVSEMQNTAAIDCLMDLLLLRAHKTDNMSKLPMWQHHDSIDRGMSTLLYLTIDVLERISPAEEKNTLRILRMFSNLCNSMPFKLDESHVIRLYQRVHETLAVFLVSEPEIARVSFQTMYRTSVMRGSSAAAIAFSPRVVEHIVRYAQMEKENNEPHNFFNACSMALKLTTDSLTDLNEAEVVSVQKKIKLLLKDLEAHLLHSPIPPPSPSLVVVLLGYLNENPDLLPELNSLIDLLRPIIGVHGHAFDQHNHSNSIDTHRQAFRLLRDIYRPRPHTRRQQVVDVQELNELGLLLPPSNSLGSSPPPPNSITS